MKQEPTQNTLRIFGAIFLVIPFGYIFLKALFIKDGIVHGHMTLFDKGLMVFSPWLVMAAVFIESWHKMRKRLLWVGLWIVVATIGTATILIKMLQ